MTARGTAVRGAGRDAVMRRCLPMVPCALSHNKAPAARGFGCCWATVQAAAHRAREYGRKGDVRLPQHEARWQVSDLADLNQRAEDFGSVRFYLAT